MRENYEIVCSFRHVYTKETMFRVKVTYDSGSVCYQVFNEEELKLISLGEW